MSALAPSGRCEVLLFPLALRWPPVTPGDLRALFVRRTHIRSAPSGDFTFTVFWGSVGAQLVKSLWGCPPLCRCRAFTLWNVVRPEGGPAEHPWSCRVRSDWPRAQWVLEGFGVCASLLGVLTHCHSLGSLSSIYSHRSGGGKSDIGCRQVRFLPDCGGTLSPGDLQRLVRVCTPVSVVLEGCQACWMRGHLMTSTLISCLKTL